MGHDALFQRPRKGTKRQPRNVTEALQRIAEPLALGR
jgi:hypothetical protein